MAGTLASLLIKLGLDATGVEQGVAKANASGGRLSTGAGTAMRVAGSLIGSGLAVAAKGALEMQDRAAQFQADTGAGAEEARHFAETVNAAAGSSLVSMEDIAQSATKIRTDLGLTGDAADKSVTSFPRAGPVPSTPVDGALEHLFYSALPVVEATSGQRWLNCEGPQDQRCGEGHSPRRIHAGRVARRHERLTTSSPLFRTPTTSALAAICGGSTASNNRDQSTSDPRSKMGSKVTSN
jgi:hypothetical protein